MSFKHESRIQELAALAEIKFEEHLQHPGVDTAVITPADLEKFTKLVVTRCASIVSLHRRDNLQDKAISDTLEAAYREINSSFGLKS